MTTKCTFLCCWNFHLFVSLPLLFPWKTRISPIASPSLLIGYRIIKVWWRSWLLLLWFYHSASQNTWINSLIILYEIRIKPAQFQNFPIFSLVLSSVFVCSLKIEFVFIIVYAYTIMKTNSIFKLHTKTEERTREKNGVLRKLKHIFPNTYQRIKSICSPAKGGTGCYRFNYQPGS